MSTSPITTGWITLNTRCNNRCSWCYQLEEISNNPTSMTVSMAKQLVGFFHELDILSCIFIGGEPTLHKGLPELVGLAKDRGIEEVTVVTNGRRLSRPSYVQRLISVGVDLFSVTIHSIDPAIHNKIAGVDAWQQTYDGILNVLDLGGKCIINLVAGRENLHDIEQSILALLELGAAGITVSSAVGSIDGEGLNDSQSIDPREYAELVWHLRCMPSNVGFLHELPLCLYLPDRFIELIKLKKLGYGCHIGIGNGLSVNPQGVTIPCNSMYNLPMISLFQGGKLKYTAEEFLVMWRTNQDLLELRALANVYRSECCRTCQLWDVCNSGCPLTWANLEPEDYINSGLVDIDLSVFSIIE